MRYGFFSPITVVGAFVLLGPFLWFFAFLLVNFGLATKGGEGTTLLVGAFLFSAIGAVSWWTLALSPGESGFWLITWIPTVLAAVIYWLLMSLICQWHRITFRSRLPWVLLNFIVCAATSAAVFILVGVLPMKTLEFHAAEPMAISNWVAVVAITGGLLGLLFAILAKPKPKLATDLTLQQEPRH